MSDDLAKNTGTLESGGLCGRGCEEGGKHPPTPASGGSSDLDDHKLTETSFREASLAL